LLDVEDNVGFTNLISIFLIINLLLNSIINFISLLTKGLDN
jgi:hypothetical protein